MKAIQARIVGAMAPPDGQAPFMEASLVVEGPKGIFVGSDEGEPFSEAEWEALLAQREAQRLFSVPPYESGLMLWLFRPTCVFSCREVRQALRLKVFWVDDLESNKEKKCSLYCYVLKGADATAFRAAWASKATQIAEEAIAVRDLDRAVAGAHTAFHLQPRMSPRATALLSYVFRLSGNATRAEGYIQSAERSFGAEFVEMVRAELDRLEEREQ